MRVRRGKGCKDRYTLLERGTDLRIIQDLLGHKSVQTIRIYTHVTRSMLEVVRSPLDSLE